jgi:hypothetical protein
MSWTSRTSRNLQCYRYISCLKSLQRRAYEEELKRVFGITIDPFKVELSSSMSFQSYLRRERGKRLRSMITRLIGSLGKVKRPTEPLCEGDCVGWDYLACQDQNGRLLIDPRWLKKSSIGKELQRALEQRPNSSNSNENRVISTIIEWQSLNRG